MNKPPLKILLVEGDPDEVSFFLSAQSVFPELRLEWTHAERLSQAIHRLGEDRFDVIVLDLSLPDSQGLDSLTKIQTRAGKTPIIVLVGTDEQEMAIQAVQRGAQDYLNRKQRDSSLLLRSIHCAMERHRFIEELIHANQNILDEQKSLVEEDRFNLLLKVTGTTVHELKQPLTALLGNIELMKLSDENPEGMKGHITEIEKASKRISNIVSKMQQIRHEDAHLSREPSFLHFDQARNLLSLEDTDTDFGVIEGYLKDQEKLRLSRARTIQDGLLCLERSGFDLVLLDYLLPDGNGLDFLKTMNARRIDVPVVFITGQGDEMIAAQAIQAGACDYLTKGKISRDSLLKSIMYALEKARLSKEVSQIQNKIVEMSIRDELTGLYNRRYMEEMLHVEFSRAKTYQTDLSCMILDLDHFKRVNDSFGHVFGDFVLREFAACLKNHTRSSDWRFRYGGEEFTLLVPHTDIHGARRLAEKLRKTYEELVYDNGTHSTQVTVSIGVASKNHHQPSRWEDLIAYADKALYAAKANGRNCVKVFPE